MTIIILNIHENKLYILINHLYLTGWGDLEWGGLWEDLPFVYLYYDGT